MDNEKVMWCDILNDIEEGETLLKFDVVRFETASNALKKEIIAHHDILYEGEET